MKKIPKNLKKFDIVLIQWEDPTHLGGWHPSEVMVQQELLPCETVGFYLGQDKRSIYVSLSIVRETDTTADAMIIPESCIMKIKKLKT